MVTAGVSSAPSTATFTVGTAGAPTISGLSATLVSPLAGSNALTITGTHFDPAAPQNNSVTINGTYATVGTPSATSLPVTVPYAATSGRVTVSTAAGSATSSADLYVVPTPYTPAQVDSTGRLALGGSLPVTISSGGHVALLLVDGQAGQVLRVQASAVTLPSGRLSVLAPDTSALATANVDASGGTVGVLLPSDGTYTVLVVGTGGTGGLTVTASLAPATLSVDASSLPNGLPASGTLAATWSGLAGPSAADYLALYPFAPPGHAASLHTGGTASGSVPFAVPANVQPGVYTLRLYTPSPNGNPDVLLATSAPFKVGACLTASVSATATVASGSNLAVSWAGVCTPNADDWVGLFLPSDTDLTNAVAWVHTSGTASGSVALPVPLGTPPGTYEVRLYPQNTNARLTTSGPVAATQGSGTPAPSISVGVTGAVVGSVLSATWRGITDPHADDWLSLARVIGPGQTQLVGRTDLYVNCTGTPTVPRGDGTCPLVVPADAPAGQYAVHYNRPLMQGVAASTPITIGACPAACVGASPRPRPQVDPR